MPQLSTQRSTPLPPPQPLPSEPLWVKAFSSTVQCGFPSPAEDHQVERIDLMSQLIKHPQATFMLRVSGESMRDVGILDGSVVLVDKAINPESGHIVIAVVDGDFTCKTLQKLPSGMRLKAANPDYADIVPKDGQTVEIWGVVVASIVQHAA